MGECTELARDVSERLRRGSYECAVCSETVHLGDKLWACHVCYGVVHMKCVRFWVRAQVEEREKQINVSKGTTCSANEFRCPICISLAPTSSAMEYKCFCGKVKDPIDDPLLVPGSCGQMCERRRKDPLCVHCCTLMCHPGPCPPCNLTRTQFCFCGKSETNVGCSSGIHGFECGEVCGKLLDCGRHKCAVTCHEGPCPICTTITSEPCFCGGTERKMRCGDNVPFSCGTPCAKKLDCGNHQCSLSCHKGACQPCLRTPERQIFCPCGKVRVRQLLASARSSCLDPVPSCGLVCGAPLPCNHTCLVVCHDNPVCPPCTEPISMQCACGSTTFDFCCFCTYVSPKEWQEAATKAGVPPEKALPPCYPPKCSKLCRRKLSCGRHVCNETCCSNEDHTCYRICTKRLSCGNHCCGNLCHKGPCIQCCNVSFERLYCRCRRTWIEPPVPCGTKPPNCSHVCSVPRPCGHPPNHPCHIEEECSECTVPVEKKCDSHAKPFPYFLPCYLRSVSCGKKCGKPLTCCGKKCEKTCHAGRCDHECANVFPLLE